MKIHHITIQNFLGARQIDMAVEQPITLLAGMNGAGKSSLKDAISLALTADLCRVSKKGDAAQLVSDGAASARVFVQTNAQDIEVAISKAGKITDGAAGSEPHPALPFLIEPARFARLTDAERRAFLFGLLGIETSHKAIGERMARRGLDEQKIAAVLPVLRAGFAAGERHAKELASQARGAWKAVTGETYGSQKADGWQPAPVTVDGDPLKKADNARAKASECEAQIAQMQQKIGASRAARQAYEAEAIRRERLRDQAKMVDRIRDRLKTAEENVAACRAQLAAVGGEDPKAPGSYLLRGLASVTAEFIAITEDSQGVSGYHMTGDVAQWAEFDVVERARIHLAEYRKLHGDPDAQAGDPARADEIRRGLQTAESGAANARRDLAAAEAAAAELLELEKTELVAPAGVGDIEEELRTLSQRRNDWLQDERKYRDAVTAAERRASQIADAAGHHTDVQQWSAIADALSPNGIQAEMIAEALDPLNKRLAEHAALAQWQPVRIDADMTITVGGRLRSLCSESECWRADALLALTIAQLSEVNFLVLDRLDCLDATGREDALYWLSDVAEAGQIGTVIVLATLKSAPPADALPAHIASHWLERGSLASPARQQTTKEAA